jgi:hypothetical protein
MIRGGAVNRVINPDSRIGQCMWLDPAREVARPTTAPTDVRVQNQQLT